jgi:aminoacylase
LFSGFDIRITPTVDFKEFEEKIKKWCSDAGDDVFYEFKQVSKFLQFASTQEYQELCNDL